MSSKSDSKAGVGQSVTQASINERRTNINPNNENLPLKQDLPSTSTSTSSSSISTKDQKTAPDTSNTKRKRRLALVPLRPPSKKKQLEVKQLPIVLGRTNLAQWCYQSCDCQNYYCRLHCRPVAQNIGSLSKVMIQIDTAGKVHIVGKNPHLVTITPERKDFILQVNDILSIGRRDREPWMRFQVVENTDGKKRYNNTNQKQNGLNKSGVHSSSPISNGISPAGQQDRTSKISTNVVANSNAVTNGRGGESGQSSDKMKQNVVERPLSEGAAGDANASSNKNENNSIGFNRSSSNLSSGMSRNNYVQAPIIYHKSAAQDNSAKKQPKLTHLLNPPHQSPVQYQEQAQGSRFDTHLPEWITTTTGKRNRGSMSPSPLSAAQGTNSKQQQHQAMVARLTKVAAAAEMANATLMALSATNKHSRNQENDTIPARRKRRKRHGLSSARDSINNGSNRKDQIHLVFQDYETSAKLIKATQRSQIPTDSDGRTICNFAMSVKSPRADRNFISKPGEGPSQRNDGPMSPRTMEGGGEEQQEQVGLLSKNFAAALLGVASDNPGKTNGGNIKIPSVVVDGERVVVQGKVGADQDIMRDTAATQAQKVSSNTSGGAVSKRSHMSMSAVQKSDSATCRAALAKYAAEKEAAAARKRESTYQSQGEKTNEAEGDEDVFCRSGKTQRAANKCLGDNQAEAAL